MQETETKKFFEHIWPSEGFYCISHPALSNDGNHYYKNRLFDNIDNAVQFSLANLDKNSFMCIGTLASRKGVWNEAKTKWEKKSQNNIEAIKTFILDIDTGEEKPYPNKDAINARLSPTVFCNTDQKAINTPAQTPIKDNNLPIEYTPSDSSQKPVMISPFY